MKTLFITCIPALPDNTKGPTSLVLDILRALSRLGLVDIAYIPLPFVSYSNDEKNEIISAFSSFGHLQVLDKPFHNRDIGCLVSEQLHFWWPRGAKALVSRKISEHLFISDDVTHVVFYPYFFSHVVQNLRHQLANRNITVVGMDSASLLNLRRTSLLLRELRLLEAAPQVLRLFSTLLYEKIYLANSKINNILLVGKSDVQFMRGLGIDSTFVYHPYTVRSLPSIPLRCQSSSHPNSVSILFSKLGTSFYGSHQYRAWFLAISRLSKLSSRIPKLSICLHQCSSPVIKDAKTLLGDLVSIHTVEYVHNYSAFVASHDIAAFPLYIGAGTKNSALSAISLGLTIVATPIALENISYSGAVYETGYWPLVSDISRTFETAILNLSSRDACRTKLTSLHSQASFDKHISQILEV